MLGNRSIRLGRKSHWEIQEAEQAIAEYWGVHLEPGEHLCTKCGGRGLYPLNETYEKERCDRCWGEKKLDWVEMAMGKRDPYEGMSASSSSCSSASSQSASIRPKKIIKMPNENLDILDEASRTMGDRLKEWVDQEIIDEIIKECEATK